MIRRFGANCLREGGKPYGYLGWIVINDVVDTRRSVFDRQQRGTRHIVDMDLRPHSRTIADDRKLALTHNFRNVATGSDRRARPVEAAVA
jgi:hypothetical protein